jgi:hypothetical protein
LNELQTPIEKRVRGQLISATGINGHASVLAQLDLNSQSLSLKESSAEEGLEDRHNAIFLEPNGNVADPRQKFRIRFRIRSEVNIGSGFEYGSESWIRIQVRNWPKLSTASSSFYVSKIYDK